jgi:hypothetical protein
MNECFTIYDSKANHFATPFFSHTIETALRALKSQVNKGQGPLHDFPEDYILFHIGRYNPETGQLEPESPRSIANCVTLKDAEPQLPIPFHDDVQEDAPDA